MRKIALILATLALTLTTGCRDNTGPSQNENPAGDIVVWYNGLSNTVDAWFPKSDSLVQTCWISGNTPNAILDIGDGDFAVLSSLDADLRLYDSEQGGAFDAAINLPVGSNPYGAAAHDDNVYITLLLTSRVAVANLVSLTVTHQWDVPANPSGIAYSNGRIFVTHGNWPETSSRGGVTVLDAATGDSLTWLDTGINTTWARAFPESGMVHVGATTYADDGAISIIDPVTMEIAQTIDTGGSPGEPIRIGREFISPNGWSGNQLLIYIEGGRFEWFEQDFNSTCLAYLENSIYSTDFSGNCVRVLSATDFSVQDTLAAGGEGPQGIIALDR
ncbi:MAG: hypothetical protein R6V62_09560 [Candidatus Fermentibacteraceae bacterium]